MTRVLRLSAALSVAATLATPASAEEAIKGEPSLHGEMMRYPPSSVRYTVLGAGVGMFGVAYGLSAISAATWPGTPGASALYAPVVGPMISLANSGCSEDNPSCGAIVYVRGVLYVIDTLVQTAGLALVTEGVLMTTEAEGAPESSIRIAPVVTPHQAGVGVVGQF